MRAKPECYSQYSKEEISLMKLNARELSGSAKKGGKSNSKSIPKRKKITISSKVVNVF